jgi:hypothetical protein
LTKAQEGQFLHGFQESDLRPAIFCAMGAIGNPASREVLQFWARNKADTDAGRAAVAALESFGEALFEEILERSKKAQVGPGCAVNIVAMWVVLSIAAAGAAIILA